MRHDKHSIDSSLLEQVIEHLFLGELLRRLWLNGVHDIDVLRPEVDRAGYDLAIAANGIMRHIQLKASYAGARTSRVNINASLQAKQGACVIWIRFDPEAMTLGPFYWFGAEPGKPAPDLGSRIAKHTRGDKAHRPNIRVLNKGAFTPMETMHEVADALFGLGHP